MDEVELIETPACDIARRFCHGNEEAAEHVRAAIRQAVSAEREACATWAQQVVANGVVVLSAAEVGNAIRNRG